MTIGELWDVGAYKGEREIIERSDGSMGGSRIFVPQLSPDGSKLSGRWIGHNPLVGCTVFTRESSGNANAGDISSKTWFGLKRSGKLVHRKK